MVVFGQDLAAFWGDYDAYDFPNDGSQADWDEHFTKQQREAEAAGKQANAEKMLGFYVDLDDDGETVLSPVDIASGTIAADLRTAAQVIEMLLIKDHSRMKLDATTPTTAPTSSSTGFCPSRTPRSGTQHLWSSGRTTTGRARSREHCTSRAHAGRSLRSLPGSPDSQQSGGQGKCRFKGPFAYAKSRRFA